MSLFIPLAHVYIYRDKLHSNWFINPVQTDLINKCKGTATVVILRFMVLSLHHAVKTFFFVNKKELWILVSVKQLLLFSASCYKYIADLPTGQKIQQHKNIKQKKLTFFNRSLNSCKVLNMWENKERLYKQ